MGNLAAVLMAEAFSSMVHNVAVSFFPLPCTQLWPKPTFFLPGFVEASQSDLKLYPETKKDSLTMNQTKSLLFFKSSEYVKLYERLLFMF